MAAADCAEGKGPPPTELLYHWKAQNYETLPFSGGTAEQPAGLIERMTAAGNAYYAWKGLSQSGNKNTWRKDNPDAWKTCVYIMDLRKYG